MLRFFLTSLLFMGVVTSCTPRTQVIKGVTVHPVLVKLSESAKRGQTVTVQGRYMGGPLTGKIILGATADGTNGFEIPNTSVKSWTDTEVVFTIPSDFPPGGSWLFIKVGDMLSNGLPYSVKQ
ncbi:hypothetical protein Dxin01_00477 [Deinococcus xinjiangensis]|uniref:IPT/TIG domain-containing protein n=1 Tax=Deinococcus xinjiangensis TaxID=457454 RepID=A0ABP9VAN4_9DEIO